MQAIISLPRRTTTTLLGRIAATKAILRLKFRYACDLVTDMIITMLCIISSQKHLLERLSKSQDRPAGQANMELYEAIMYPDDKKELVSIVYNTQNDIWELNARPAGKQLGRLIHREDRVLLLCPRKLVEVLDKGRHGASMISVEDAYSKWQTKHVLVNRLSAPGQNEPSGNMPDFGAFLQGKEGQDLRLSSHDIFHIRNLKAFLVRCSTADIGSPAVASSILKSWMVTMPQILSILEDKAIMRKCKMRYWELVRQGRIGSTVYLQLHDLDDIDGSSETHLHREPPVHTADTRTIAALRFSAQAANHGNMSMPNGCSGHEKVRIAKAGPQTARAQALADQTLHPYGKDLNINDPQTYFEKFGSLTPPQQTANILMALSFFLRPPELEWEDLRMGEVELNKNLSRSWNQTPEVFIASRKTDNRMASLSEVTRVATAAVHRQFEIGGKINDERRASSSRWQTVSNDETDLFRSPIYHQRQVFSLGSPVYMPQRPDDDVSEPGTTAMDSTTTTPKACRPRRFVSTEATGTVRVRKQQESGELRAGVNGNGAILNPEAPSFTMLSMPSKGALEAEEKDGLFIPTGEWPSINIEDAKRVGVPGYQDGKAQPKCCYTSTIARPSFDGESEACREDAASSSASADQSDTDVEQGGAELTEV